MDPVTIPDPDTPLPKKLHNAFCYARAQERTLDDRFPLRMAGTCRSVLRYMVLFANHGTSDYAGHPITRGEIAVSQEYLSEQTGFSRKSIRNALKYLEEQNEIIRKRANERANGVMVYAIINYELWDATKIKGPTKGHTKGQQGATLKEVQGSKETTFVASHEATRCLQAWEKYRPIIEKHRDTYLQVFDELHRLDKLPWEGEDGIFAICAFAVKEWEAKHIQAPSKLRKPSKQYPELKTWQVIQGQIQGQRENGNGHQPDAIDLLFARVDATRKAPV